MRFATPFCIIWFSLAIGTLFSSSYRITGHFRGREKRDALSLRFQARLFALVAARLSCGHLSGNNLPSSIRAVTPCCSERARKGHNHAHQGATPFAAGLKPNSLARRNAPCFDARERGIGELPCDCRRCARVRPVGPDPVGCLLGPGGYPSPR